ncbi:MAG: hypothetical protein JNL74_10655, partial [Fibrobacteres bacterium]|nr:hypothetical protein [Fibrobacterota bacterium]
MKYFGKKSLSSVMSTVLNISWILSIIACVIAPFFATFIIFFSTPAGESFMINAAKKYSEKPIDSCQINNELYGEYSEKDRKDWAMFKSLPLPIKLLIIPYFGSVLVLLLLIIRKSRILFANFKNDVVFNMNNVQLIATISKLLIPFSIIT